VSLRLSQAQTVLVVAGALLLLTNLYLGISFVTAQDQKGRLASQYRALEQSLERLVAAREADPSEDLGASAPAFPKNPPSLELTDLAVRAARETGVEVLGLHTSTVGTEQLGSGTYRVVKVSLRLRADPARLAAFFERVERAATPTMVFDNVDVVRADETWEASLELLAYAQAA